MPDRLEVTKTYKLFIDGKFPRSESGRTIVVTRGAGRGERGRGDLQVIAHVCRASRKDLRDAVTAARKALPGWSGATAYLRGQIMYRMAEMLEGKREEFIGIIQEAGGGRVKPPARDGRAKEQPAEREVDAAIERLVCFAGWADKFGQVLGCNNQVAGPYYNFTVPQATGVVGVVAPDEPPLLGLISLIAPAMCSGNTVVALSGDSGAAQLCAAVLGEVCATSDVPAGVLNLLTGVRDELAGVFGSHRDIDAIHAGGVGSKHAAALMEGTADNVKRVTVRDVADWYDASACQSPWWIEPLVEFKTIWHPSAM